MYQLNFFHRLYVWAVDLPHSYPLNLVIFIFSFIVTGMFFYKTILYFSVGFYWKSGIEYLFSLLLFFIGIWQLRICLNKYTEIIKIKIFNYETRIKFK
jgi:hypothetical protein